jgi:hypothetical protein
MEQKEAGVGKEEENLCRAIAGYGSLWAFVMALSFCPYLSGHFKDDCDLLVQDNVKPSEKRPSAGPEPSARGGVPQASAAGPPHQPVLDVVPDPMIKGQLESIKKILCGRLHEPQDREVAYFKILFVIALTILWFWTFLLINRVKTYVAQRPEVAPLDEQASAPVPPKNLCHYATAAIAATPKLIGIVFAAAPALIFALSMYRAYEPAVFMMALVAIFVAAEHYGELGKTGEELEARTADLKNTMGTVLDADGLNTWRAEVYALYRSAAWRIDAVIRSFDIDLEWWKCAGAADPWRQYVDRCAARSGKYTLLRVMGESRAKVQFAVEMPLPTREVRKECPKQEKSKFFRDLLGLAWYLVVFNLAFKQRQERTASAGPPPAPLRIKLTHAPSWMHVVDYTVYQGIERSTAANSTVRELTHSVIDPAERRALSGWARENVRRFARRGERAEEYVFSVLRYGAYQDNCQEKDRLDIGEILNNLGMQEYLDEPKEDFMIASTVDVPSENKNNFVMLTRADAENLCEAVFAKLIESHLPKVSEGAHVKDLIRELL